MLLAFYRRATRSQLRRATTATIAYRAFNALEMSTIGDDAVYDSEPERQRAREERRRERRARRAEERAKQKPEIIDTPSDEEEDAAGPSIVAHGGESCSCDCINRSNNPLGTPFGRQRPLPRPIQRLTGDSKDVQQSLAPITSLPGQHSGSSLPSAAPTDEEAEDELGESQYRLPISRFAYTGAHPSRSKSDEKPPSRQHSANGAQPVASSSTTLGPATTTTAAKPKPKGAKKLPTHRFAADFTDADLARFTTCISCNVAWTMRKSGTQKMVHVQTCARKSGLSDELVRTLVRKQIDATPAGKDQDKGKGKGKAKDSPPAEPETLLENLVNENAPRKKGRKVKDAEQVETVLRATETHDAIKDRARALFGLGLPPPESQAMDGVAATQVFQPSRLPAVRARGLLDFDGEEEASAPPATQAFQPSRLGGVRRTLLDYDGADDEASTQTLALPRTRELPPISQGPPPALAAPSTPSSRPSTLPIAPTRPVASAQPSPARSVLTNSVNQPTAPRTTLRRSSPASARQRVPTQEITPQQATAPPSAGASPPRLKPTEFSGRLKESGSGVIEIDDDDTTVDVDIPTPIAFDDPTPLPDPWDSDEGVLIVDMPSRDPTPVTSPGSANYAPLGTDGTGMDIDAPDEPSMAIDDDPWDDTEAYLDTNYYPYIDVGLHTDTGADTKFDPPYTNPVHTPPSSPSSSSLPELSPVKLDGYLPRKSSALSPRRPSSLSSPHSRSLSLSSSPSVPLATSRGSASPGKRPQPSSRTPASPTKSRKTAQTGGSSPKRVRTPSPNKASGSVIRTPASSSPKKPATSSPKKPATTRKPRAKAPKDPEPAFDDAWAARITGLITADRALHFRILRYEPISFDVFTQLTALEPGASSGKFKFHLRALLDKLAINFYGADSITWRPKP
ncbi:hypothetical protein HDZ31DRAFT_31390 [Schizophyllum fasciatum]